MSKKKFAIDGRVFGIGDVIRHYSSETIRSTGSEPTRGYYLIQSFCTNLKTNSWDVVIRELFGEHNVLSMPLKTLSYTCEGLRGADSNIDYRFTKYGNIINITKVYLETNQFSCDLDKDLFNNFIEGGQ